MHSRFKLMRKNIKEMLLFFKSTKQKVDEINDQLVRDFEDNKN